MPHSSSSESQAAALGRKTILLTGASGFIGAHLHAELRRLGADVHAVSRQRASGDGSWHQLDLADEDAVRSLMRDLRPKIVFHLASYVAGARDRGLVLPTFHANLASTVYLLDAAVEHGCERFVQVGSLEEPDPDEPVAVPSSPYAAAKAAASAYGRMFHQLYDLPVVLARLFMVYGPAQRDLRKLIPYLILTLLEGRDPKLSSGLRPVDWIYVEDVVRGLVRAALADDAVGQQVDLGSGRLITLREVVEALYRQLAPSKEPPFGTLPDRPFEQVRKADIEASGARLDWQPAIGLDEGLRRTIEWYTAEWNAGRAVLHTN